MNSSTSFNNATKMSHDEQIRLANQVFDFPRPPHRSKSTNPPSTKVATANDQIRRANEMFRTPHHTKSTLSLTTVVREKRVSLPVSDSEKRNDSRRERALRQERAKVEQSNEIEDIGVGMYEKMLVCYW